jgi:hypothetical protein
LRAIGIILQAKVFINLQESLLMGDTFHELRPASIVAKQTQRGRLDRSV